MKTSINRTRHDIERKVSEFLSVHSVILLNPGEVNELTWGYPKEYRKELRGTWIAHGIVSQEMFTALKTNTSSPVVNELSVSTTLDGAKYAVILTQLGPWQHRFLMPLYESKAIALFTGASRKPLSLFFTSDGGDPGSMFFKDVFEWNFYKQVAAEFSPSSDERNAEFALDLPLAIRGMLLPHVLPSVTDTAVVPKVELSVLIPRSSRVMSTFDDGRGSLHE